MPAIAELRTSDVKLDGEIVPFVKLMDFSPMLEPEKQKKQDSNKAIGKPQLGILWSRDSLTIGR